MTKLYQNINVQGFWQNLSAPELIKHSMAFHSEPLENDILLKLPGILAMQHLLNKQMPAHC